MLSQRLSYPVWVTTVRDNDSSETKSFVAWMCVGRVCWPDLVFRRLSMLSLTSWFIPRGIDCLKCSHWTQDSWSSEILMKTHPIVVKRNLAEEIPFLERNWPLKQLSHVSNKSVWKIRDHNFPSDFDPDPNSRDSTLVAKNEFWYWRMIISFECFLQKIPSGP